LYVFFVISHGKRELIHLRATAHPTAEWLAQQMVEACGPERGLPRYLIHDRDGCYGPTFNRRVRGLGITQIRTPVKAPKANGIAERWVRTVRAECLDHMFIFNHQHLQHTLCEYVTYYNAFRPHRSLGQRVPCQGVENQVRSNGHRIIARPVLGGLHHVYGYAA
jgi:transposase InsO family protein